MFKNILDSMPRGPSHGWCYITTAPKNLRVLVAYQDKYGAWQQITARYYLNGNFGENKFIEGWYADLENREYKLPYMPQYWQELPEIPER